MGWPTHKRCETCLFFEAEQLACRHGVPHPVVTDGGAKIHGIWPPTRPQLWCGQWKPSTEGDTIVIGDGAWNA